MVYTPNTKGSIYVCMWNFSLYHYMGNNPQEPFVLRAYIESFLKAYICGLL